MGTVLAFAIHGLLEEQEAEVQQKPHDAVRKASWQVLRYATADSVAFRHHYVAEHWVDIHTGVGY